MEEKLDKSAFAKLSFKEADNTVVYWRKKTPGERLEAAYFLSLFGHMATIQMTLQKWTKPFLVVEKEVNNPYFV